MIARTWWASVSLMMGCGSAEPAAIRMGELPPVMRSSDVFSLGATVVTADGAPVDGQTISYLSSAPTVASVSADGHAVCHAAGPVSFTVTSGKLLAKAELRCAIVAKLEAPQAVTMFVGDTPTVTVRALAQDGSVIEDAPITWASSAPAVASVDAGNVRAVGGGLADLLVESGAAKATVGVIVHDVGSIDASDVYVMKRGTKALLPVELLDHQRMTVDARPTLSSDGPVVSVTKDGWLHADQFGTATIKIGAGRTTRDVSVVVFTEGPTVPLDIADGGSYRIDFREPGFHAVAFKVRASDGTGYGVTAQWSDSGCYGTAETQSATLECFIDGYVSLTITNPTTWGMGPREVGSYAVSRWPMSMVKLSDAVRL